MDFVMFDIGSGNGTRAHDWLKIDRRAHAFCFDPLNECYEKACETSNKRFVKGRLHAFKLAITSDAPIEDGEKTFYCSNDRSSCSLLPFASGDAIKRWRYPPGRVFFRTTDEIQVPVMRMDKFMADRRLNRVTFVRIESQGTALDVVKSFGQKISQVMEFAIKVHVTPFELYQNQTTKEELVNYMERNNFDIYGTQEWSRGQEEIIWFVNRASARTAQLKHFDFPNL